MAGLYGGIIDEFATCLPPASPARSVAESLAALSVAEQCAEQRTEQCAEHASDEPVKGTIAQLTTDYDAPNCDSSRESNNTVPNTSALQLAAEASISVLGGPLANGKKPRDI